MSKYTTEVRFICETSAGLTESGGFNSVNDIIKKAIPNVFNFDFPIFDENYRNVLCTKILKHYYTREIGLETVGLWKLKLDTKLNEIMPYYNKMYESETFKYNPLYDTDYTREHTLSKNGNDNRVDNLQDKQTDTRKIINNVDHNNIEKYSDTPQGRLTDLLSGKYLTNATENNGTSNNTETHSGNLVTDKTGTVENAYNSTDEYVENVVGKMNSSTSYSTIIKEYREALLNIDMMIIDELNELFFYLW